MSTGAQYVVAAYGVVLFALVMYVAELLALLAERAEGEGSPP